MVFKKKKDDIDIGEISNEADRVLNDLAEQTRMDELEKQRAIDAEADKGDTQLGRVASNKKEAALRKAAEDAAIKESKGAVLTGGVVSNKFKKPEIEPGKVYKNFPVKTIQGVGVTFQAARPFHDKSCDWDEKYRNNYEHFIESDHPIYHNSAVTAVKWTTHEKVVRDGFVIKTDEEIQLFLVNQ